MDLGGAYNESMRARACGMNCRRVIRCTSGGRGGRVGLSRATSNAFARRRGSKERRRRQSGGRSRRQVRHVAAAPRDARRLNFALLSSPSMSQPRVTAARECLMESSRGRLRE